MGRTAPNDALLPSTAELARLVRAAHDRVPHALDDLVGAVRPWLVRYFSAVCTGDEAEDLTQIVLMRLAKRIARGDGMPKPESAGPYIVASASRLAHTGSEGYRARRDRRHVSYDLCAHTLTVGDPATDYDGRELECAVAIALRDHLAPAERAIFGRRLLGHTPSEIASDEGVSAEVMRQRMARVKRKLRRLLKPYLDPPAVTATSPAKPRISKASTAPGATVSSGAETAIDGMARAGVCE
jgi:RNA polymerase sigma factor (sigma-70 family)